MLNSGIDLIRLHSVFARVGKFALEINYVLYCFTLTVIFTLKTGVRGILPWGDFKPVENFPVPTESFSSNSHGLLIISKLLNITSKNSFFIMNALLLMIFLSLLYLVLFKRMGSLKAKLLVFLFLSSPIYTVLAGNIGRHDLLSIMGMIFFFLFNRKWTKTSFLFLACLGSPEHTLAAFLLYFLAILILKKRDEYFYGIFSVLISSIFTLISSYWVHVSALGQSRFNNILTQPEFIRIGLRNFANNFLLEWYSYYGYFWFFIFIAVLSLPKLHQIKMLILLCFPIIFNIVMVDKTRDFVVAIIPFSFLLLKPIYIWGVEKLANSRIELKRAYIGLFLILAFLFPSIEITFEGQPRAPFFWVISKIMEIYF
jgi:hypothetical protein